MNEQMKRITKRKNNAYILFASIFIFILIVGGVTLAWLTQHDEVKNTATANDVEIKLLEPEWYKSGITAAEKLEPGMTIPKDPQVFNSSESSVYVRMKLVVKDKEDNEITGERYQKIIDAIYLNSGSKLLGTSDGNTVSNNSDFVYQDGWFYYAKVDNSSSVTYTVLNSGEVTSTLFDYLKIPVLKSEYLNYFDSNFSVDVEAQAIPSATEGDIISTFERNFS